MPIKLLPYDIPAHTSANNIKAWADERNNLLIGSYLRRLGDLFIQMDLNAPEGAYGAMTLKCLGLLLDDMAWEIEGKERHTCADAWLSERITYELLAKCFEDYEGDDR